MLVLIDVIGAGYLYFDRGDYMVLIRYANETDLADITSLMSELGYETTESEVTNRLSKLIAILIIIRCGD